MKPLVSVCIPAYNNADYITETIHSILNQTYENLELVVVDDQSGDDTYAVVAAMTDPRIRLYRNEQNLGMSGNWNRCLSLCTGEYIKLVCADDLLDPTALEREVGALMEHPEAVLAESDTRLVDPAGKTKGYYKRYRTSGLVDGSLVARKGFFKKNYFGAPLNNTFPRAVLERVKGFDSGFTYILDYDLWVSIACLGQIYIIHEPLNSFRMRSDSNTGNVMGGDKEKNRIYVEEHRKLLEKNRKRLNLSATDIKISVLIRRILCLGSALYMKLTVRS
ncbi:MAG: glycosyltransferase family 2 protein [Roseburia sp.]